MMTGSKHTTVTLDARGLAAPEPLERALDALQALPAHGRLVLRIHREPYPLYDILRHNGYLYQVALQDDGYCITIWQDTPCSAP